MGSALWWALPALITGQSGYVPCDNTEVEFCGSTVPCIWIDAQCREDRCRWSQTAEDCLYDGCGWRTAAAPGAGECLSGDSPTPCRMYTCSEGGAEACSSSGRCRLIGEGSGVSTIQ